MPARTSASSRQLHELTLALIETATIDEVLNTLQDELRNQFQADAVELRLFSAGDLDKAVNEGEPGPTMFRDFMQQGRPKCGALEQGTADLSVRLPGQRTPAPWPWSPSPASAPSASSPSAAAIPTAFHPGKGTDFLRRLGEVVSRTLQVMSQPGA